MSGIDYIQFQNDIAKAFKINANDTSPEKSIARLSSNLAAAIGSQIKSNTSSPYTLPRATTSLLGGVKIGDGISVDDGVISVFVLPEWARQADKPSYIFSEINEKPTTVSGYGIIDAVTGTPWRYEGFIKTDALTTYQLLSEKGAANGYAGLDSNSKINLLNIPDSLLGQVKYKGTYNISTNLITSDDSSLNAQHLPISTALTNGFYFIVQDVGTVNGLNFVIGDWLISDGFAGWSKVDNTDAVSSVNGYTGPVVLSKADVGLNLVDNTSDLGKPVSNATQTALNLLVPISTFNSVITNYERLENKALSFISATDVQYPSAKLVSDQLNLKVDKVTGSRLITSAESILLGNTSNINSGDNAVNSLYSGLVSFPGFGLTTNKSWGLDSHPSTISGYGITDIFNFPGFGATHALAAYGDHNHDTIYQSVEDQRLSTNNSPTFANVTSARFSSTIATGTAPFVVTSTTPVVGLSIGGNAATATILQTARTIWGQSFNGSTIISGAISGTAGITPSANNAYSIGLINNRYQYVYALNGNFSSNVTSVTGTFSGAITSTKFIVTGGTGLQFLMADGTTQTIGPQGPQGIQGIQGIQGVIGLTGDKGDKGDTGLTGGTGSQGPIGLTGLTGPQGVQGLTGATGAKGDTGLQGIQGIKGDTGAQGIQGIQGLIGNTGLTGAKGDQGIQGVQGLKGDQGIQGIAGTVNINGLGFVKANGNTISYDNNTYSTVDYVDTKISDLIDNSPALLDTLNELSAALGDDPNFSTTVMNAIGSKQSQLDGVGLVRMNNKVVSYDNNSYITSNSIGYLNTLHTEMQDPDPSESFSSTINLHKIAKTGYYTDLLGRPNLGLYITLDQSTPQTIGSSGARLGKLWGSDIDVNGLLVLNRANLGANTYHELNRDVITTEHMFKWSTGGVGKYYLGQRSVGSESFSLYSAITNNDVITINPSGIANFSNTPTIAGVSLDSKYLGLNGGSMNNTNLVGNLNAQYLNGIDYSRIIYGENASGSIGINETNLNDGLKAGFYTVLRTDNSKLPALSTDINIMLRVPYVGVNNTCGFELLTNDRVNSNLYFRASTGGSAFSTWKTILDSSNFTTANYIQNNPSSAQSGSINLTGAATFASTVQTTGITPTNLTTNYIPMKSSGVLVDSPISFNGDSILIKRDLQYSPSTTGQIQLGSFDGLKRLMLGYDSVNNFGFLEAVNFGVAYSNISINPNVGNVGIGYTTGTEITNNKLAVNGSGLFNGSISSKSLSITTNNYDDFNIGISQYDSLNRLIYETTNNGQIRVHSYIPAGATAVLINESTPVNDMQIGHYAYICKNSAGTNMTPAAMFAYVTDTSPTSSSSKISLSFMGGQNTTSPSAQPNRHVYISDAGLILPILDIKGVNQLSLGDYNHDGNIYSTAMTGGANAGSSLTFNMAVDGGFQNSAIARIKPSSYNSFQRNTLNFYVGGWNNNNNPNEIMTLWDSGNVAIGYDHNSSIVFNNTFSVNGTVFFNGSIKSTNLSGTGTRMVVADSLGVLSTQTIPSGGGGGSVVSVGVDNANGFYGGSSGGVNPSLSIKTSITGLLKGDGTSISAMIGTGFLKMSGTTVSFDTNNYIPYTGATTSVLLGTNTITASNFILSSDIGLKTNIKPISVEHIDLKYYEYELISNPGKKRYGVIAQDLLQNNPELVSGNEKDMYGVHYTDMLVRKVAELEYRLKGMEDKYGRS